MAEEAGGQEKSEEPTGRRIADARKKGDVAKSMEIPSAAVLLASLLTIYFSRGYLLENLLNILRHYLGELHTIEIISGSMNVLIRESMYQTALVTGPLMVMVFLIALAANLAQFGFLFSTEKIAPKLSKIDPIQGLVRMFSMQMLANTVKSFAKVGIVSYVAYAVVIENLADIPPLMDQEPIQILGFIARVSYQIFLRAALIIALLAILDYAFQKWQFKEKMKMTKQEVKDEAKQTEGDPQIKGRIRAIQMEMARKRMMAEVPTADVVITNPTHLAIALRYDNLTMAAPTVIAKGAGIIAHRIKEIAQEHNVPVVEDKPLARALFKTVELDEPIPENLFQAVAEVLAYVYNLKGNAA